MTLADGQDRKTLDGGDTNINRIEIGLDNSKITHLKMGTNPQTYYDKINQKFLGGSKSN
jgi:hypothetical protein